MTNKKPQLRFREFEDSWKEYRFDEIFKERHQISTITDEYPQLSFTIADGVIRPEDRKTNKRDFLIIDKENKKYLVTELDDIIYNPANVVYGAIHRNKLCKGVVSPIYKIFYSDQDSSFLECIVRNEKFINEISRHLEGTVTKLKTLKPKSFFNMYSYISKNIEEQEKIGCFIEYLDKLIATYQRKSEKLIKIKKACLIKMFPTYGNINPIMRFKTYTENWNKCKLSEVVNVYDGTHQTPKYKRSGIMFLSVENIKNLSSKKYISEKDFKSEFKIYPQKGDVLMTRIGNIGIANVYEKDEPAAYYVSLALLKSKTLKPYFLKENIHSNAMEKELWLRTLHIAFPKKINKNEIENTNICFPDSTIEQEKIGYFFNKLNILIELYQSKSEKLKNIKKACLNKMFI